MMEEKEEFDLESDFIEYWDDVIRIWLNQIPITCKSTYQPISVNRKNRIGENIYKDSFSVAIEDEQMSFFQHHQLRDLLCPAHMPEPYWGDPNENKCSLVVVDYNPGGGEDMSPHTYKSTIGNNQYPPNTMIKYVNEYSYSKLAKDFPIWKKDLPADKSWLSSYGGRDKFWLKKKKWVQHLVDCCVEEVKVEDCPPFAIELCGWHSPNWPDNTGAFTDKDNTDLQETVAKRFALPLLKAIENSKSHLAICIGAQFKPSILRAFLPQLENITEDVYKRLLFIGVSIC